MNWDAIGAIGEIIGALAVLVTLIYLAVQVRQATLTARAAAINASTNALRENRIPVISDQDLSEIFRRALMDPNALDEGEFFRFRILVLNVTDVLWDVYNQSHVTNFSPETWQYQGISVARRIVGSAGGRRCWEEFRSNYPPEFQNEIDRILNDLSDT